MNTALGGVVIDALCIASLTLLLVLKVVPNEVALSLLGMIVGARAAAMRNGPPPPPADGAGSGGGASKLAAAASSSALLALFLGPLGKALGNAARSASA